MASVYINDFDRSTYQYDFLPSPPASVEIERLVTGFEPAYSRLIVSYAGAGGVILGHSGRFGSMLAGLTTPKPPVVEIDEVELKTRVCTGVVGQLINPFDGAAVTVDSTAAPAGEDQSLGFFLYPVPKIAAVDLSLTFDTPTATTANKFSVAIILKSGDQTDQATDQRLGIDTQFKNGDAYFVGLLPTGAVATPAFPATLADSGKTFANYASNCTQFTLHYTVTTNAQGTLTATASLQVGSAAAVVPVPSFDIKLPNNLSNLSWVTAIGASITTTSPQQIGATFRQFAINSVTLAI